MSELLEDTNAGRNHMEDPIHTTSEGQGGAAASADVCCWQVWNSTCAVVLYVQANDHEIQWRSPGRSGQSNGQEAHTLTKYCQR